MLVNSPNIPELKDPPSMLRPCVLDRKKLKLFFQFVGGPSRFKKLW